VAWCLPLVCLMFHLLTLTAGLLTTKDSLVLVVVWHCGGALVSINKVNLHRTRLVLGWLTVSGFNFWWWQFIWVCNQLSRSTQPGHPFVGRRNEYQPKCINALRLGVKAGMVHVWVAGRTVRSLVTHRPYLHFLEIGHYKVSLHYFCLFVRWHDTTVY